MKSKSRYDDPAYREQVAKQMLSTPTLGIACRAIIDLRAERKHDAVCIDDLLKQIKALEKFAIKKKEDRIYGLEVMERFLCSIKKKEDRIYGLEVMERFLCSIDELQQKQAEDMHYVREWKRAIESDDVSVSNIKEYKK